MVFIDVKVKRMVRVRRIMRVAPLRLRPADDLAHVLDQGLALGDVLHGKDAFSMHAGATGLNAAVACGGSFFGHG